MRLTESKRSDDPPRPDSRLAPAQDRTSGGRERRPLSDDALGGQGALRGRLPKRGRRSPSWGASRRCSLSELLLLAEVGLSCGARHQHGTPRVDLLCRGHCGGAARRCQGPCGRHRGPSNGIVLESDVPAAARVLVGRHRRILTLARAKVGQIAGASHMRCVGRGEAHLPEGAPIEAPEPLVLSQCRRPHSRLWLLLAKQAHELRRSMSALVREADLLDTALHELVNLLCALSLERCLSGKQLEEEDAEHPPIHCLRVPRAQDNLGRHIVRGAHKRVGLGVGHLGKAHVGELAIAPRVEEKVLRLQIPVDDVALVEMRQRLCDAAHVEAGVAFAAVEAQALVGGEELPAQGGLQEKVDVLTPVVGGEEADDKGRLYHFQDPLLVQHRVLHAQLRQVALRDGLQGEGAAGAAICLQSHYAESAHAQAADALKVRAADAGGLRSGRPWRCHHRLGEESLPGACPL
mmetsp:Transcript_88279/g.189529  ORF Transcript_88279/g.189529 Transcript_88279/m.189529 type:complete len:463 (-) Transcript_88279:1163-2551(-)